MANISKIKLKSDGTVHDIEDATARNDIKNINEKLEGKASFVTIKESEYNALSEAEKKNGALYLVESDS